MSSQSKPYMQVKEIKKSFKIKDGDVQVLKSISTTIGHGEFVIIFGPSGCGKSTFLHTLLGLEPPTSGSITIDNKDYYSMSEDERAMYRRYNFGIIYQQPLWITSLNVYDNIAFTLHLLDKNSNEMMKQVLDTLSLVGMDHWVNYRPTELSSGQQQKISLARALALDPVLIVADEPTGNLDTVSGQDLINTFCKLNKMGKTIIMVTHDLEYLHYGTHLIHMLDGQIVEDVYLDEQNTIAQVRGKRGLTGEATAASESNVRDPDFLKNMKQKLEI